MIELANSDFSVGIDPAVGGSLSWFRTTSGVDIFQGARAGGATATDAACFPMVPFCNRVRQRSFELGHNTVLLEANTADGLRTAHGFGWRSEWALVEQSAEHAVIQHDRPAGDWPWTYVARQRISIDDQGLTIDLSVRNLSTSMMPAGLGLHPYFPLRHEVFVKLTAARCSRLTQEGFPTCDPDEGLVLLTAAQGQLSPLIGSRYLAGVTGPVIITDPIGGHILSMHSSANCSEFALHVEPENALFCIEPMSHRVGAINDYNAEGEASGVRSLPPGAAMHMTMRCVVDVMVS